MGGGQTLASFAVGAITGGTAAALYYLKKDEKSSPQPTPPPTTSRLPTPLPSPQPVITIPSTYDAPAVHNAREIMKYGFPGPVNDVLYRKAYVASYNRAKRNPNWVAEHLRASSFSTPPSSSPNSLPSPTGLVLESEETSLDTPDRHKASFREDLDIPRMFRAKLKDYSGSGFDRGHLVPAADVKESQEAMSETFLLTNISPQVGPGFNRAYWFHFENFTRSLTTKFDDVYVVTGPLYLPKKEEDGKYYVRYQVIGEPANTAVPTHFYKVILGVKDGKPALGAFVLPNEAIEDRKLEEFVLPLDAVEHASGLVFFPEVNRLSYKPLCQVTKCEVIPFRKAVRSMNGAKAWGIV